LKEKKLSINLDPADIARLKQAALTWSQTDLRLFNLNLIKKLT